MQEKDVKTRKTCTADAQNVSQCCHQQHASQMLGGVLDGKKRPEVHCDTKANKESNWMDGCMDGWIVTLL